MSVRHTHFEINAVSVIFNTKNVTVMSTSVGFGTYNTVKSINELKPNKESFRESFSKTNGQQNVKIRTYSIFS